MVKTIDWLKERWFDFRNGHNIYGAMVLQFINFILLVRLVSEIPSAEVAVLLVSTYGPLMIGVGYYYHRRKQLETDQNAAYKEATLSAKVSLVVLKMIEGTASKEEIAWAKGLLSEIAA